MKKHGTHSPSRVERHMLRRTFTYAFGLSLAAFSANLSIIAGLGNSAVNSSCLIFSSVSGLDLGTWLIFINLSAMVAELCVLGRDFQLINLAQVPFTLIYGKFVSLIGLFLPDTVATTLYVQIPLLLLSVCLLALGILIYVGTELVPMPLEGLCLAIASKTSFAFHNIKTASDCAFLVLAIVCSFLLFGRLEAVGVGTIVLALGTGTAMGILKPLLPRPLQNWHLT